MLTSLTIIIFHLAILYISVFYVVLVIFGVNVYLFSECKDREKYGIGGNFFCAASRERLSIREGKVAGGRGGGWGGGENATEMHGIQKLKIEN